MKDPGRLQSIIDAVGFEYVASNWLEVIRDLGNEEVYALAVAYDVSKRNLENYLIAKGINVN